MLPAPILHSPPSSGGAGALLAWRPPAQRPRRPRGPGNLPGNLPGIRRESTRNPGIPPHLMSTSLMTEALPMRCSATTQSPRAQYLRGTIKLFFYGMLTLF